jgi:RNA polymerase sigma-70 factor (sigma-E family)
MAGVRVLGGMAASSASEVWGGRAVAYVPADDLTAPAWTADEAVTRLFASQYRPLVRLAALLLHDVGMAEEIAQDAFVSLHQRWGRLRDPEKAAAYLRQSVVNRARSALRHRGVVDRFLRRQPTPATAPSAEAGALTAETYAEVLEAVRALPTRQREALVLRYYGDLSEIQTAEAMGVSPGAVKSHTARALAALRRTMEPLT